MGKKGENILLLQFVFLKGMAFIYLTAFMSIFYEINSLIGYDGLLPVHTLLRRVKEKGINKDMSKLPTLLWWAPEIFEYIKAAIPQLAQFDSYETVLHIICLVGVVISLTVLFSNKAMHFITYFILWFLYLSIFSVGQLFFQFQWDIMLLEAGFLTVFLTPTVKQGHLIVDEISSVARDLLKWLSFRLNFASGVVKLTSQCPTWWNLTALHYHFETQPLPNPLSYYFHHLPSWLKKLFVAQNFVTLIGGSLLLYAPVRRLRQFGGLMLLSEQFMIILTGNYNFFNFLTTLVTLASFDDKFIKYWTPRFILKMLGNYPQLSGEPQPKGTKKESKEKIKEKDSFHSLFKKSQLFLFFLIFVAIILAIYYKYLPLDAILKDGKVNFTMSDIKVNLVNGYIPLAALIVSMLFCVNNLFAYSLKYDFVKQNGFIRTVKRMFAITFAVLIYGLSSYTFFAGLEREMHQFPMNVPLLSQFYKLAEPYYIANSYGLFRRMTGVNGREELVFEVSEDGVEYKELTLFYKPGPVDRPLPFVAPYHPRLDWQLWFSAMKPHSKEFLQINDNLIHNKPSALSMIDYNPLQGKEINYLNVRKYIYRFTTLEERQETGNVWKREKHQLLIERVMRGQNNLEQNLILANIDIDTKPYPVHILRQIVPLIELIWASLFVILVTNYLSQRKRND